MSGFAVRPLPTNFLRTLISRNRISQVVIVASTLALAVLATAVLPVRAHAQAAVFSTSKNICIGVPDPFNNNPNTCPLAPIVGVGQQVFYVVTVSNPPGSPQQYITLTEHYPAAFTPGAIVCTDQTGTPPWLLNVANPVIGFQLQLDTTVTCTIAGTFSAVGLQNNIVDVDNKESPAQQATVQTTVAPTTQLTTDLQVTKTVSPSPIGANTANTLPATVTYTVTIKNNGPAVDVGHWFVLHDTLALLPGSVPLYATVVPGQFTCVVTSAATVPPTDCLDTAAMNNVTTWPQRLIGTMAPQSMFDWSFQPYPTGQGGHIAAGATITLTWQVKIESLPNLTCVKSLTSNGLKNQAFFTLTNPDGTAANDSYNPNNTASAPLTVNLTGTVDPNCGAGQLTMTKAQVSPANPVTWGGPTWPPTAGTVTYDITIKNTSMPQQTITIPGTKFEDFVVEGIGTPPFTRTFVGATCVTSNPVTICNGFNSVTGGGNPPPPAPSPSTATQFNYTFYGQQNLGWRSKPTWPLTLAYGDSVTIRVAFNYFGPDCETVPNVIPKLIDNKAQITYMATVVGAASGSPQNVQYTQVAIAHTQMRQQPPCKFVVTKNFHQGSPKVVQFGGPPMVYDVTFTNNDVSRNIGTVMDSVRLTDPAYATQVPFKASWVCTQAGGVTPLPVPPVNPVNGNAIYTASPVQGSPVFQFTNLYFNNGAQLTCTVTVTTDRPAFNNPNCSMNLAYFENAALMDVTHPYNTNVPWPPSPAYNPGALSNPNPQNTNWATLKAPLPKCYNFNINKTASVNGFSPAWTTTPGGLPVQYSITMTNTGTSGTLTGGVPFTPPPGWNGLRLEDVIAPPPYNNNIINPFACTAGCVPLSPPTPPPHSPSYAGIQSLVPNASVVWKLTLNPPFIIGQPIKNCASATPQGIFTGPEYYPNYDPANPPPPACVQVPVLATTTLGVTKRIVNQTGQIVAIPASAFGVHVGCQTYPLQSAGNLTLTVGAIAALPNGGSTNSPTGFIQNVPVAPGETCTVTETTLAPVPLGICGHGGIGYWDTAISPAQPMLVTPASMAVTVTNTLRCRPPLTVTKTFVNATGSPTAIQPPAFNIQVTCSPTPLPVSTTLLQLTPAATTTTSGVQATVPNIPVAPGETCTVTEPALPPVPATAQQFCGGTAYWDSSPAYTPSSTIPVAASGPNAVTVTNTLRCHVAPKVKLDVIKHIVDMTPGGTNHIASPYIVTPGCNPASTPGNVSLTEGVTQTVLVPLGAQCTPNELLPPVPGTAIQACSLGAVGTAHWETPAYVPPPPFTVTSTGPQTLHVFNVLRCGPSNSPGTLTVLKRVSGPAGTVPPPIAFSISVQCGTLPPVPRTLSANGWQTVVASPPNCTVSEIPPVPLHFATPGCPNGATWLPATYAPSASVTVPNGTASVVVVTNGYQCLGPPQNNPAGRSPGRR